jgi:hypothetical protein
MLLFIPCIDRENGRNRGERVLILKFRIRLLLKEAKVKNMELSIRNATLLENAASKRKIKESLQPKSREGVLEKRRVLLVNYKGEICVV